MRALQLDGPGDPADLSEREKDSDRDEVRHILPLIEEAFRATATPAAEGGAGHAE